MKRRVLLQAPLLASACAAAGPLRAQTWPSKPIRLVVPFPAGGPTDSFARLYAGALGQQLGQTVVVENKPGASGALGALEVKRASPDGYTLLFGTASTHALYNLIQPKPQFDALEDSAFVGVLGGAPVAFAVVPSMPATLKAVLAAAKAQPEKLRYGSPGNGTLLHVAAERLKQQAGVSIVHVPYKGSAPAMQDLIGGSIEMTVDTLGSLWPQHQAGRLRIVGVASAARVSTAPEVPTVAESAGFERPFEAMLWNVVTAPRDTPAPVLKTLIDATQRAMGDAGLLARLSPQAMFAHVHLGAAGAAYVRAEREKWKPIVANLGDLSNG